LWKLSGCSAELRIEVLLLSGLTGPAKGFARIGESEHVDDMMAAVETIRQAGAKAEQAMQQKEFSSKEECEENSKGTIFKAVEAAAAPFIQRSHARDSGPNASHTWRGGYPFR
jgi:hypothetical protein